MDAIEGLNFAKIITKPDLDKQIEIPMVVPGMFPAGYVTLLVGDPKSGKTWLSLRLACELSKGGEILEGFAKVDPSYVLYLMGDTGAQLVNYRLKRGRWLFNRDYLSFTYAEEVRQQGHDLDLGTNEGWTILNGLMVCTCPGIVFIDTLTSFHSLDESDNTAVKPVITKLRDMAAKSGAAVVLLHHTRKRKRAEANMSMTQHDSVGAGVLARLCGNVVAVEKKLNDEGGTYYLVRSLASWFKEFRPFSFTLEDETGDQGQEWVRMPINLSPEVGKDARETIIKTIEMHYWDGSEFTRNDIIKRTGLSHVSVSHILNELITSGKLKTFGATRDKKFYIPIDS